MRNLLLFAPLWLVGTAAGQTGEVRINILSTTDLHGYILPYDYFTAKPAERGLAKISTLVARERERNPN